MLSGRKKYLSATDIQGIYVYVSVLVSACMSTKHDCTSRIKINDV